MNPPASSGPKAKLQPTSHHTSAPMQKSLRFCGREGEGEGQGVSPTRRAGPRRAAPRSNLHHDVDNRYVPHAARLDEGEAALHGEDGDGVRNDPAHIVAARARREVRGRGGAARV
jgi:hypothetical protein